MIHIKKDSEKEAYYKLLSEYAKLQEGLKIAELLNRNINAMNKELEAERDKYRNMVFDLQEQIEKMKCCYNCKHSRTVYEHCRTNKHEKWEIKENE